MTVLDSCEVRITVHIEGAVTIDMRNKLHVVGQRSDEQLPPLCWLGLRVTQQSHRISCYKIPKPTQNQNHENYPGYDGMRASLITVKPALCRILSPGYGTWAAQSSPFVTASASSHGQRDLVGH